MGTITTNAVRSEDTKNATITRAARVGLVVKGTRHFEKLSLQIIHHVTSESLYLYHVINLRKALKCWHQVAV